MTQNRKITIAEYMICIGCVCITAMLILAGVSLFKPDYIPNANTAFTASFILMWVCIGATILSCVCIKYLQYQKQSEQAGKVLRIANNLSHVMASLPTMLYGNFPSNISSATQTDEQHASQIDAQHTQDTIVLLSCAPPSTELVVNPPVHNMYTSAFTAYRAQENKRDVQAEGSVVVELSAQVVPTESARLIKSSSARCLNDRF